MTPWDFAVALYARVGVEAACLGLQDENGQSVPLLLWRLWSVHEGREVDAEVLGRAVEVARTWETAAAAPLREARRRLNAPLPPVTDAARGALHDQVAAAELAAERVLLDALGALTPAPGGAQVDALPALRTVVARWGGAPPEASLRRLVIAAQAKAPLAARRRSATN